MDNPFFKEDDRQCELCHNVFMKKNQFNNFLAHLVPYLMLGVMITLFVIGLFIFSYILIISVIVGFVLFGIAYIKAHFFPQKKPKSPRREGRLI